MKVNLQSLGRSRPAGFVMALLLVLGGCARASAQVVTNASDSGSGTLRQAISNATNGAVITFAPNLSGATILLASTLTINTNLTIDASALPGGIQINGNGSVQVFIMGNTVVLNSLTITNGSAFIGGGIENFQGTLTLNRCILAGNFGASDGGGIYNGSGTLTANQCIVWANSGGQGAGIFNSAGTATLNQCMLVNNHGSGIGGGAIYNQGTLTVNECTLSGNVTASAGGGIYNDYPGKLAVNQSTLSGNSAGQSGGGILNAAALMITNSIVAANSAGSGADIYNDIRLYPMLTYGGSNIVQSVLYGVANGPAPINAAPQLAALGYYGGPTQTMPPLPGSPAIDAGSDAATNLFATDQSGS